MAAGDAGWLGWPARSLLAAQNQEWGNPEMRTYYLTLEESGVGCASLRQDSEERGEPPFCIFPNSLLDFGISSCLRTL